MNQTLNNSDGNYGDDDHENFGGDGYENFDDGDDDYENPDGDDDYEDLGGGIKILRKPMPYKDYNELKSLISSAAANANDDNVNYGRRSSEEVRRTIRAVSSKLLQNFNLCQGQLSELIKLSANVGVIEFTEEYIKSAKSFYTLREVICNFIEQRKFNVFTYLLNLSPRHNKISDAPSPEQLNNSLSITISSVLYSPIFLRRCIKNFAPLNAIKLLVEYGVNPFSNNNCVDYGDEGDEGENIIIAIEQRNLRLLEYFISLKIPDRILLECYRKISIVCKYDGNYISYFPIVKLLTRQLKIQISSEKSKEEISKLLGEFVKDSSNKNLNKKLGIKYNNWPLIFHTIYYFHRRDYLCYNDISSLNYRKFAKDLERYQIAMIIFPKDVVNLISDYVF